LAMKGRYPQEELSALPSEYRLKEVTRITVPDLDEERHVVRIMRGASTAA
jgi:16S rRNA G527 N7-methylase RsmG